MRPVAALVLCLAAVPVGAQAAPRATPDGIAALTDGLSGQADTLAGLRRLAAGGRLAPADRARLAVLLRAQRAALREEEAMLRRASPAGETAALHGLRAPAPGAVRRRFAEATPGGPANGVTLAAGPGRTVAAGCDGRVAFAKAFRSFNRIAIVDCGGGWQLVLAGLGELLVSSGARVAATSPVGRMPMAGGDGLYVEARRDGVPVDPLPLFGRRPP